jgi:primosomal protein N' (replication factor Y)
VEELAELFPDAIIERMDRDTVGKKDSYRKILGRMRSGEANILVGTQMIAKGHDLPGVTIVGIIDADIGLHAPDFRSSEKTFQLITQASGRAGRGAEPGRVIIQTRQPKHPTIVATQTGRFKAFARYELDYRRQLQYPPWGRLMRLVVSSPDPGDAHGAAKAVRAAVEDLALALGETDAINILGPAPAPHERLRGRFRWHLLVKGKSPRALSRLAEALDRWKDAVRGFQDFRLVVDIDPVDML